MSINEYAISIVRHYISRLEKSEFELGDAAFDVGQIVYTRWAANEILSALKLRKNEPPISVIEEFSEKFDKYSCLNTQTSYAFSVAYDTAMDILDLFIS